MRIMNFSCENIHLDFFQINNIPLCWHGSYEGIFSRQYNTIDVVVVQFKALIRKVLPERKTEACMVRGAGTICYYVLYSWLEQTRAMPSIFSYYAMNIKKKLRWHGRSRSREAIWAAARGFLDKPPGVQGSPSQLYGSPENSSLFINRSHGQEFFHKKLKRC